MRTKLMCIYCSIELSKKGENGKLNGTSDFFYAQIEDEGAYNVECPNGHKNFIVDQNLKFQLLFESGIYAYLNGFYRESVGSIWASLERFYEFASKTILLSFEVNAGNILATVSETGGASEKQIGGFYYLYSARFREPLKYLHPEKDFGFRNKVIHKGHFPTETKTMEFMKRIYGHITEILSVLNRYHHKYVVITDGLENMGKTGARTTDETKGMLTVMKMPVCINLSSMINDTDELLINDLERYVIQLRTAMQRERLQEYIG